MKTILRNIFVAVLLTSASIVSAQQVNTLYFLENAPMRHTINPAFQPVSNFYLTLPVIGYTSLWTGTNNWTMSDFIFKGPNGNTITPFHPDAPHNWLEGKPNSFIYDTDMSLNLFGFGFRIKQNSYLHINITERVIGKTYLPSAIFGINKLNTEHIGPWALGADAQAYTEFALGFSHKINSKWTIGAKLKALTGQAHVSLKMDTLELTSSYESMHLYGNGAVTVSAQALDFTKLPTHPSGLQGYDYMNLLDNVTNLVDVIGQRPTDFQGIMDVLKAAGPVLKPAGIGAALDFGFTYKPVEQLQLTASVTDLGFMRWENNATSRIGLDTTFNGVDVNYGDYGDLNGFDVNSMTDNLTDQLSGYANSLNLSNFETNMPYMRMLTANLNVGIDANFWKNRIGLGVYSHTRFYDTHITEEVTFGAALRPANWFNLAASYSFINGRWSNVGAAISLAPYDGIMLTLATDYVPVTYAKAYSESLDTKIPLPYKTTGLNLSFGVAIVAGTNKPDKDKDGVWQKNPEFSAIQNK